MQSIPPKGCSDQFHVSVEVSQMFEDVRRVYNVDSTLVQFKLCKIALACGKVQGDYSGRIKLKSLAINLHELNFLANSDAMRQSCPYSTTSSLPST